MSELSRGAIQQDAKRPHEVIERLRYEELESGAVQIVRLEDARGKEDAHAVAKIEQQKIVGQATCGADSGHRQHMLFKVLNQPQNCPVLLHGVKQGAIEGAAHEAVREQDSESEGLPQPKRTRLCFDGIPVKVR